MSRSTSRSDYGACDTRREELDRVAGGILDQHLRAARPAQRLVPEADAGGSQPVGERVDVVDLEHEAVPATRRGTEPSGIGLAAEVWGPLSQSSRPSRSTIANGGPILAESVNPSRST